MTAERCRVRYDLEEISHPDLAEIIEPFIREQRGSMP